MPSLAHGNLDSPVDGQCDGLCLFLRRPEHVFLVEVHVPQGEHRQDHAHQEDQGPDEPGLEAGEEPAKGCRTFRA